MAMRFALSGEPPPSRHWDDPDLDEVRGEPASFALQMKDGLPFSDLLGSRSTAVIAASPASVALLRQMLQEDGAASAWAQGMTSAAVLLPGEQDMVSSSAGEVAPGQSEVFTSLSGDSHLILVLVDGCHVAPEACFNWTKTLFSHLQPERVVILGPLPAPEFSSQLKDSSGSTDVSSTVFGLEAGAMQRNADASASLNIRPLPPGALIDGLPASIISYCQVRQRQALLCCCGQGKHLPSADYRAAVLSLKQLLADLSRISLVQLPDVPRHCIDRAVSALAKKSHLPSDMYI